MIPSHIANSLALASLAAENERLRARVAELERRVVPADLEALLVAARAAKADAGSGAWTAPSEGWTRSCVMSKAGEVTSRDDSPYAMVQANHHFPYRAVLEHIAAACPDVVIALVERVRAAEAARDAALTASYEHGKARGAAELALATLQAQSTAWIRHADETYFALVDEHRDALTAHADAQSMLEEIAAERDAESCIHSAAITSHVILFRRLADSLHELAKRHPDLWPVLMTLALEIDIEVGNEVERAGQGVTEQVSTEVGQ